MRGNIALDRHLATRFEKSARLTRPGKIQEEGQHLVLLKTCLVGSATTLKECTVARLLAKANNISFATHIKGDADAAVLCEPDRSTVGAEVPGMGCGSRTMTDQAGL